MLLVLHVILIVSPPLRPETVTLVNAVREPLKPQLKFARAPSTGNAASLPLQS